MSKSGSKALSKSVDSVVKSVESVVTSVLPKNMNMKHVLLAILVGLLLCMLMGNSIEPFSGAYENPSTGYCYNSDSGLSTKQGCKAKGETGVELICSDKTAAGGQEIGANCGTNGKIVNKNTFCRRFSDNLNKAPSDEGDSCNLGTAGTGNGDICDVGLLSDNVDCSGLTKDTCPGAPDVADDDQLTQLTDGQRASCNWYNCDGLSSGTDDVKTAFNYPQVDYSLKKWAKCVENNPGTKWAAMKTSSKDELPEAWSDDKWGTGVSTGKAYGSTELGDRVTDKGTLKPLVYKEGGSDDTSGTTMKTAYDKSMFPSVEWDDMFNKKIKFCGAGLDDDLSSISVQQALDNGSIVGWNSDKTGLICLNNNPAIETNVTQTRIDVVTGPGCGQEGNECYCSEDGCPCGLDVSGPTPRELMDHKRSCGLGDTTAALNSVNRNVKKVYKDTTDTLKGAVHQTCGTITGFTGTL